MILFRPVFITTSLLTFGTITQVRAVPFYIMRYMLLEDGTISTIINNVPEPTGGVAYVAPPTDIASTLLSDTSQGAPTATGIASISPTAEANIAQSNGAALLGLTAMYMLVSSAAALYLAL